MEKRDMVSRLKEKLWKMRIPAEYRECTLEEVQEKYAVFYKKLERMADDPNKDRKKMEQLLLDNQNLIKATRRLENRAKKECEK